MVVMIDIVH